MNPDQIKASIQAVVDGLTPLAQKLQIPLEGVFGWAIKHNYAVAITYLLPLPVAIVCGVIAYRNVLKSLAANKLRNEQAAIYQFKTGEPEQRAKALMNSYENEETVFGIVSAIFGGLALMMAVATFLMVPEGVQRLIAPEWFAAQDIVHLIKR